MTPIEIAASGSGIVALLGFCVTGFIVVAKLGRMTGTMEASIKIQNEMIGDLKKDIAKLGDVVTQLAVQSSRLDNMGTQVTQLSMTVRELQHGEGFIFPLQRSPATQRNG